MLCCLNQGGTLQRNSSVPTKGELAAALLAPSLSQFLYLQGSCLSHCHFQHLLFPLYCLLASTNPISTFPPLLHCLQHCQDQLCYFPCCCPACCLQSYFLAFRENQKSQISYFHHTHCLFLSNELMNPPEALGACRVAWLPLQSLSHLKMSPLQL